MTTSQSSTHKALRISEIQRYIVEYIHPEDGYESRVCLANLARTSKLFENVALDALWSNQYGLVPLVRLLGDAVGEQPSEGERDLPQPADESQLSRWRKRRTISLRRDPTLVELERIDVYALRIKHWRGLHPYSYPEFSQAIEHKIILSIFERPSSRVLFPNTRTLEWPIRVSQVPKPSLNAFFLHFVGPNLKSLRLGANLHGSFKCTLPPTLLEEIHNVKASLSNLIIDAFNFDPSFAMWLERILIMSAQSLRAFRSDIPLSAPLVSRFSTFPNLTTLDIDLCRQTNATSHEIFPSQPYYPQLTTLDLQVYSLSRLEMFFGAHMLPAVRGLRLWHVEHLNHQRMKELAQLLLDHISLYSLRTISITFGDIDGENTPWSLSTSILPDSLRPFLKFPNITEFSLAGNAHYDLDDGVVADLVNGWPQLQILDLGGDGEWPEVPKVDIGILRSIMTKSPYLWRFGCSFDCRGFSINEDSPSARPSGGHALEELRCLDLGQSLVDDKTDIWRVAAYLSDVAPSLSELLAWDATSARGDAQELQEDWQHIRELYDGFCSVRSQERRWWRDGDQSDATACSISH